MPSSSGRKKTSFIRIRLAPFWVRRWLLHIYFDSMKLHHKILQWLSIFLFYLDSQLFLHTSYFANPSIIHLICVCVHQINNLLLHELNQKWFHNATTYILLLHCKCTNCEKSSKLECGMYILNFFHEMASRSKSYVQSNSRYDMNDISQTANLLETQFVERYNHRIYT